MRKTKQAFSLVIAMGLVLITVLLAVIILEYITPFSRSIRGIENSSISYYLAYSGVENGVYFFSRREGKDVINDTSYPTGGFSSYGSYGYSYATTSSGSFLPEKGTGTSEYDSNRNTISMGEPIQLSVGYGYLNPNNFKIYFRVPETILGAKRGLSGDSDLPIINWQISSETETLNSIQSSLIKLNQIGKATENSSNPITIGNLLGRKPNGTEMKIGVSHKSQPQFYNYCTGQQKCILRFSVINPIKARSQFSNEDNNLPYLEWRVEVTGGNNAKIPLRYSRLKSVGRAYGYNRTLDIRYPQDTVTEALDFAVFQ